MEPTRENRAPSIACTAATQGFRCRFLGPQAGLLQRALLGLPTRDVVRLALTSGLFFDACFSPEAPFGGFVRGTWQAHSAFRSAAAELQAPRGWQTAEGVWLHGLLPLRSIGAYISAGYSALCIKGMAEGLEEGAAAAGHAFQCRAERLA